LEDLLDEEIKKATIILVAKEIMDMRPKKRQGSTMGQLCIPWDRARRHNILMRDYFDDVPTYPADLFRC
jgi:hypothetical protein